MSPWAHQPHAQTHTHTPTSQDAQHLRAQGTLRSKPLFPGVLKDSGQNEEQNIDSPESKAENPRLSPTAK